MKMCFLCQIVNKDNNTPQAEKNTPKRLDYLGSHFNNPKNDFLCSSEHGNEAV